MLNLIKVDMRKLLKQLHTPTWLFWLLVVVFVLRIPSFFEPYSYGDEMIYLTLGEAIRRGIPLYSGIHDNKPPLLYVLAAIAGSLFWFKAILAIWHLVTVFIFWKLAEVLFPKKPRAQQVATVIFALLTTIPLLEGNIINAELFMIGPTILAFLILLTRKLTFKNIFLSGILFSISTLFKIPAAFDVPTIVFLWIMTNKFTSENLKQIARNSFVLLLGFATPIAFTFLWYFLRGALGEYIVAAYLQNFGYLSSWRPSDLEKPFLLKNAPFLIRGVAVFAGLLVLFWKRKKLSKEFIFATSWLLLSLFAVTLSERPYPHYLIQSVPAISLLASIMFASKNREQSLVIIPLTLAFFVPVYFKFWYYPTLPYYYRFVKLATGQISKSDYLNTYGDNVERNYKIANFVVSSTKPFEKIFVWGDGTAIYALSRRLPPGKYVADYHIKDFSSNVETIKTLKKDMPSFIIILPAQEKFSELDSYLRKNYGLTETIDGAEIWKLLSPGVRAFMSQ